MSSLLFTLVLGIACKKTGVVEQNDVIQNTSDVTEKKLATQIPKEVLDMSRNFQKVFFEVDQSTLNDASREALKENAEIMNNFSSIRIEIQGHADERGTTEYNLALGQRRAQAVSDYFLSQGIAPSRLKIVSYGEERPLDGTSTERAYSQNRRCEFVIVFGADVGVKGSSDK